MRRSGPQQRTHPPRSRQGPGSAKPFICLGPSSRQSNRPPIWRRVAASITTLPGPASDCSRAARFGVSPTAVCWREFPEPIGAPMTTRPVAMPTRTSRSSPRTGVSLTAAATQVQPGRRVRRLPPAIRASQNRSAPRRPRSGRCGPQIGRSRSGHATDSRAATRRRSSGSVRAARDVEPIRSQNITLTCRLSATCSDDWPDTRGGDRRGRGTRVRRIGCGGTISA